VGLIADDRGQVHDGVHAAQRVAEGEVVAEIAERDLHAHPIGPEPPRIAHQAAHRGARVDERPQQRAPDGSGGTGEQQHRREGTRRPPGLSVGACVPRMRTPAPTTAAAH